METYFARWYRSRPRAGKQRRHSQQKRASLRRRSLTVELLEPRQLLSGITTLGASAVAPLTTPDTFTANAFDVALKAQPDEWYAGYIGGPTVPYDASNPTPPSPQAIPKVNQDYLWGMTRSGDNLWLGTAANVTAEAAVAGLPVLRYQDNVQVIEGGASKYPGISNFLRPILGDWRPPGAYRYNYQTGDYQDMVQTTALKNDPLLKQTLGLRSAGATDDIVILAGPNLTFTAINLFAFKAKPDFLGNYRYLGSKSMIQYNDIRQWVTVTRPGTVPGTTQQQLYTAVGKTLPITGVGAVLRWTGTLEKPFSFEQLVTLDGEGANLVEHAGRLFVDTWPLSGTTPAGLLGLRPAVSVGIWMSPELTSAGLTARDARGWQKVWSIDNFEPDPVIAKSYSLGAMASFDGYLYWGTMQTVGAGVSAFQKQYRAVTLDALTKTLRPTAVFRGFQYGSGTLDTSVQHVQVLYGDNQLWKYTPPAGNPGATSGTWAKVPNKTGLHLFGDSGFGTPGNLYTWSAAVYGGHLYLGTYDANTLLFAPAYVAAGGNVDVLEQRASVYGVFNMRMGGDVWCFPPSGGQPWAVTLEGAGNPLNVGVRTMAATPAGLFLGTANISNLLTAPYAPPNQPLKAGGWELIRMNPISGESLPPVAPPTKVVGQDPSTGDLWYRVQTTDPGHLIVQATPNDGGAVQLALFDDAHNRSALAISTVVHAAGTIDQQVGAGQTYYVRLRGTSADVDLDINDTPFAPITSAVQYAAMTSLPQTGNALSQPVLSALGAQQGALARVNQWVIANQQTLAGRARDADAKKGSLGWYDPTGGLLQRYPYE